MRRYCIVIFLTILCALSILLYPNYVYAAKKGVLSAQASVSGHVGQFYLSVSGYIAPFASVVLVSDGLVLRSTVADSLGNFAISQVLIKAGFSSFCLDSTDYKRLGESEACFVLSPATGSIAKSNIFLPPTLGVYRTSVNVGDKALAWGYSMPGAQVTVHINTTDSCLATADSGGFYQCSFVIKNAGNYTLTATAVLNKKNSEPPTKSVLIEGLSLPQQVGKVIQNNGNNVINWLLNIPGGVFVWIALLILILIIILLWKLKPGWFGWVPALPNPTESLHHAFDFWTRPRKLHHHWMKGVGY